MLWLGLPLAVIAVIAAGAVAIAYFSTHPPRYRIRQSPDAFGAGFEEVRFTSRDAKQLSGWWVPALEPRAVLLLCHGMSAHREQMVPWASWLWDAGFSLLMFDFRAMGESEGDLCTMGLEEPEDVLGAVDYIKGRADAKDLSLGALGFSMGGVAVLLAAARDPRIEAISTLGSYRGLDSAISQRCRRHFGPLGPSVERPARRLGARWFPGNPLTVDCLAAVHRIAPRPCHFANGMKDPIVPHDNAEDLFAAASEPKQLLLLPHSKHDYPAPQDRGPYEEAVRQFFRKALPDRVAGGDRIERHDVA